MGFRAVTSAQVSTPVRQARTPDLIEAFDAPDTLRVIDSAPNPNRDGADLAIATP
jgi:hypothetical protein